MELSFTPITITQFTSSATGGKIFNISDRFSANFGYLFIILGLIFPAGDISLCMYVYRTAARILVNREPYRHFNLININDDRITHKYETHWIGLTFLSPPYNTYIYIYCIVLDFSLLLSLFWFAYGLDHCALCSFIHSGQYKQLTKINKIASVDEYHWKLRIQIVVLAFRIPFGSVLFWVKIEASETDHRYHSSIYHSKGWKWATGEKFHMQRLMPITIARLDYQLFN